MIASGNEAVPTKLENNPLSIELHIAGRKVGIKFPENLGLKG